MSSPVIKIKRSAVAGKIPHYPSQIDLGEIAINTTDGKLFTAGSHGVGVGTTTISIGIGTDGSVNTSGIITATTFQAPGGTYASGNDSRGDASLVIDVDSSILTEHGGQYLRNLIENQSTAINIGQSGTSLISSVNLYPGANGTTNLYHGGANKKLQTIGTGVTVYGDLYATTFYGDGSQLTGIDAAGSDGQIQYNNGGSFGGAAQLYYDDVNNRLGLNASSPAYTFDLGESASTIRLVSESGGTAIRIGAGGQNDFTLFRVDGETSNHDGESDSAAYGFSFKYLGSGAGNNNKLQILSDNQTAGTQVQAFTMLQDGKIGISSNLPSTELEVGGTITATTFSGSGASLTSVDADTVDGLEASQFLRSDADDSFSGTITGNSDSSNPVLIIDGAGPNIVRFPDNGSNTLGIDLVFRTTPNTLGFEKSTNGAQLWQTDCDTGVTNFNYTPTVSGNNILTTADEGSGNGLDADTVDGIQASSFLRSDANDSATGLYSFAAGAYSANVTYGGRSIQTNLDINSTSMRGGLLVRNANDYRSETDTASFMHYDAYNTSATSYAFRAAKGTTLADTFWVKGDGSGYFSGDVGIGTDSPSEKLDVRGHIKLDSGPTLADNSGALIVTTPSNGYIQLGPVNSSYCHFQTDRTRFFFNKKLIVDEGIIASYNDDLVLSTNTTTERLRIDNSNGYVGIGTDNPGYKLEVAGDIKLADTGTLWFDDTSGTIEKIAASGSGTIDYYSDATHRFYESDNNAERATFDVNNASGRLYFDGDSDTYFTRKATDCHVFVNAGTESLRIDASGNVGINTTSPTADLDVNGEIKTIDINVTSDINLKTNVKSIQDPLEKVFQIRGVTFDWKSSHKSSAGVIAQEVEKVLPELVTDNGTKTVNYNGLIGLLIETVKKQQVQIDELNSRLSKLE